MAAETLPYQNGVVAANSNSSSAAVKKPKENDRRRRRRKPKKNNKASEQPALNNNEDSDDAKENTDPKQVVEKVEIEYVPEKVDLYEGIGMHDYEYVLDDSYVHMVVLWFCFVCGNILSFFCF
ncbi:splicing factor 3B subunit [Trifolium repens]|nr:splicing factor 3B subunit [Trifolium repens]